MHTPEHWTYASTGTNNWAITTHNGQTICTTSQEHQARLIAACPTMLLALNQIAEECMTRLRKGKDAGDLQTLRLCRAAITQAQGTPPTNLNNYYLTWLRLHGQQQPAAE